MTDESILEQIAREEQLIEEYERELQRLQTLAAEQPEESDLIDDSLHRILESAPSDGVDLSLLHSLTEEAPHDFQQAIRGFCFTDAQRQSRDIHVLKGYFMADTSVEATIQIHIQHNSDSRSILVKCHLDHATHAWMSQHVCNDNLPFWIEGISNYLVFDKKRTDFLSSHNFEFERKESRVRIQLSDFLTVYWDWKWKRGEDALRLPTSSPPSTIIQPQKLEALVQVCKGNCQDALKLLRQALTTDYQTSSPLHEDIDYDEDSNESDSSPVSSSKVRSKTQRVETPMKKRKRKSGYLDIVMAKRKKR